jgi:hypothetical protein
VEAYRRLAATPDATTAEEALAQFSSILNEVEDELTAIPYDPENWQADGRLYPPQPDSARSVPGHPLVVRYRSRMHNTFIGANGSIEVQGIDGSVHFQKSGADGRSVWHLDRDDASKELHDERS